MFPPDNNFLEGLSIKHFKIFLKTYPPSFNAVGYHNDPLNSLFPNHSPEIINSRGQRALSGNVLSVTAVALKSSGQS